MINKEVQYIKIDEDGNKFYYKDKALTKFHRLDGPACEYANGGIDYAIGGAFLTKKAFDLALSPAKTISINGKSFTVEQLNSLIAAAK